MEVPGDSADKIFPGDESFGVVEWHEADGGVGVHVGHVQLVAETEIEPWLDANSQQTVDNMVQPGKVVFALAGFAFAPAGLYSRPFDADGAELFIAAVEIKDIAVEAFHADTNG